MISLQELADVVGAKLLGDPAHQIDGCAGLLSAGPTDLSFIYNKKYESDLKKSDAGVVILSDAFLDGFSGNALLVSNPYLAYAKAASIIYKKSTEEACIHGSAVVGADTNIAQDCSIGANVVIADNVELGKGSRIGAGCFIGENVCIGEGATLLPNVTINDGTKIGSNVTIHSGAVIGSDGFGYAPLPNKEGWLKIPQVGCVVIGDNVDIGANTTIDCGALENTIIGNGVKIDNQVMIAHNVEIGDHTAIAGCTGIAGSTKIGKHCTLAGGVGLVGHINIADGVHVTGMTMVTHSIKKAGAYSSGTPFQANSDWLKNAVRFKQLDKLTKKINQLIKAQKDS